MHLWESKAVLGGGILPSGFSCGNAGVDLFFVISGFIMVYIQPKQISSLSALLRFWAHRVTRIYPPYWLISLALLPIWIFSPNLFNNFYHNKVDVVRSFLLFPQNYTPLLGVGWTLIHEVYFYLVVSLALVFGFRGRVFFGLIWFSLILSVFAKFGYTNFNNIRILQLVFSPFSMTFLLGYILGLLYPFFHSIPRWVMFSTLGIGVSSSFVGFLWIPNVGVYPNNNHLFRFVAYGIPCFLIVGSSIGLERVCSEWIKSLKILGDASYAVYLLHLPIISGFYAVIKKMHITNAFSLALAATLCFSTCMGVAIVFNKVIESRTLRASRYMIEKHL